MLTRCDDASLCLCCSAFPPLLRPSSEIGAGLTGFGSLFLVLGVILLFDKALLALGNVSRKAESEALRCNLHCALSSLDAMLL